MLNLLINLVAEGGLGSRVIENIRKITEPDGLYMVVGKTAERPIYETYGECILREYAARGIYDTVRRMSSRSRMLTYSI